MEQMKLRLKSGQLFESCICYEEIREREHCHQVGASADGAPGKVDCDRPAEAFFSVSMASSSLQARISARAQPCPLVTAKRGQPREPIEGLTDL
jgi:hypothetical protein